MVKSVFFRNLIGGIAAGILISIGGSVFLACENRVVGSIFFSVALLCICFRGYVLFTGKVGYMALSHKKADFVALMAGLLANLATTWLLGLLISATMPALGATATVLCQAKLTQALWQTLVRGVFCGMLMFLAVSIYRDKNSTLGILFCVPVFILAGFEHSIADMFYFGASGITNWQFVLFILTVIAGNSIGGLLIPLLEKGKA